MKGPRNRLRPRIIAPVEASQPAIKIIQWQCWKPKYQHAPSSRIYMHGRYIRRTEQRLHVSRACFKPYKLKKFNYKASDWQNSSNLDKTVAFKEIGKQSKLPTSAIGRHILNSGHVVDRNQSFKIIDQMKNPQLLRFAEASAIRIIKPDLCVQKEFVVHLALSW